MSSPAASAVVEPARERASVSPFAVGPVVAIAAVFALVQLVAATRPRRWFDEALMLAIGRYHLDWGAADQPPLTPLLARLADTVAPGSGAVLAVPAVLASSGAVVLAPLIARELGARRRAQVLTAFAQATGVWLALTGHWLIPFTLEPAFWLAIVWLAVRWVRTQDDRLLVVLGGVVGVAAQTKLQTPLLPLALALGVALHGPRRLLTRPALALGAALALLLASPTLLWQAAHGWPQLAVARSVSDQAFLFGGRWGIAFGLIASAGPLALGLGVLGFAALLRDPNLRAYRFLAAAGVLLFLVFVVPPGRPYYLAGFHAVPAAAGAVWLERHIAGGHRARGWRWATRAGVAASVVLAGAAAWLSVGAAAPTVADRVVDTTVASWRSLASDQQRRTALFGDSYIYAAYLDTATPERGLPPAHSGSVAYGYFTLPSDDQDAALYVGQPSGPGAEALERIRPLFRSARLVTEAPPPVGVDGLVGGATTTRVWLLTGRQAPWAEIVGRASDLPVER